MDDRSFGREHARFYDAEMADIDRGDVAFYVDAARSADGPVLELACGSGRVYLDVLDAGVDADGLDVAEGSLDLLREKAAARGLDPEVWQGDMTDFAVDRTYDLAYCPFNAVQHLTTTDEQLSMLRSVHDALAPGGRFVFDVFVPSFEIICESYGEWIPETVEYRGEVHEHRERTSIVDEVEQRFRFEGELRDSDGETVFSVSHDLAMLPKRQVELLARQSPFEDWTVQGDFEDRPVEDGDHIQVWTLET